MDYLPTLLSGLDESKPSLFELLSEQQLAALIPPSLRYLLALATHRHPRYLLRILNSFDELYALLSLLIERHYLLSLSGGFTENFYGLKRERVLRTKGGGIPRAALGAQAEVRETLKLRDRDVWRNLLVMVGVPYLKRKLDESYDIHAASLNLLGPAYTDRDAYPSHGTLRQRLFWLYKAFLRKAYPTINAAYYFSLLAFNLAYLFDMSRFHSPFLWLIGMRVRRMNAADARAIAMAAANASSKPRPCARPGQTTSMFSPSIVTGAAMSSLKILLPTSIFALKFLEWWHASDFARQLSRKANEGLVLPPPIISQPPAPPPPSTDTGDEKNPSRRDSATTTTPPISSLSHLPILTVPSPTSNLCPICVLPITTPTAAQTGYVYCYTCIYKWVEGSHPRQEAFMEGSEEGAEEWVEEGGGSREGKWESGRGRDAVTGRRVLGGTGGLRRVVV